MCIRDRLNTPCAIQLLMTGKVMGTRTFALRENEKALSKFVFEIKTPNHDFH